MLHQCTQCDYSSKVKCNVLRHMRSMHEIGLNKTQESIQYLYPTEIKEQSTQIQSGLGSVVTLTTHIPIEKYNKVVGIAHELWLNIK